MELKSILVAVDASKSDISGITGAAMLAAAHEAHLIGLHVVEIPVMPGYVSAELPAEVYEIQRKRYLEVAEGAHQRFNAACKAAGIEGEWRCVEGRTRSVIETHARHCDLLCMSGPKSGDSLLGESTLSEDLVFSVGKPVLVCPVGFAATTIGDYVTIAWNESREAARAVSDAMGILSRAKKVSVVSISNDSGDGALGGVPGADLSHYLARHRVQAEAQSIHSESGPVGKALLEWSKGQGADLLVMGAYGHSRFREVLLGGATRWVLQHSTIPLLMSH